MTQVKNILSSEEVLRMVAQGYLHSVEEQRYLILNRPSGIGQIAYDTQPDEQVV